MRSRERGEGAEHHRARALPAVSISRDGRARGRRPRPGGTPRGGGNANRECLLPARISEDERGCADSVGSSRDLRSGGLRAQVVWPGISGAGFGGAENRSGRGPLAGPFVTIAVSDLRGPRRLGARLGREKLPLLPGSQLPGYTTGATGKLSGGQPIGAPIDFSIPLDVMERRNLPCPLRRAEQAELKSNWPDPGFRGASSLRSAPSGLMVSMRSGRSRIRPGISGTMDEPLGQ